VSSPRQADVLRSFFSRAWEACSSPVPPLLLTCYCPLLLGREQEACPVVWSEGGQGGHDSVFKVRQRWLLRGYSLIIDSGGRSSGLETRV
jgi:hypothetical protein